MNLLQNLITKEGYSSKKFAGLSLIYTSILMGLFCFIKEPTAGYITVLGIILSGGLACLGIDSYNKRLHINNKS